MVNPQFAAEGRRCSPAAMRGTPRKLVQILDRWGRAKDMSDRGGAADLGAFHAFVHLWRWKERLVAARV
jgi:hypothetical protein